MKKLVFAIIIGGLLSVVACKERVPYVLAEQVEVEYYDTIQTSDWIEIDGVRFNHVGNYTLIREDSLRAKEVFDKNLLPTTREELTVPGAGEKEFGQINIEYDLVYALFINLAQRDQDGAPEYTFQGSAMDMSLGKMKMRRTDGEKIKVSTSKNYGAAVRKLK